MKDYRILAATYLVPSPAGAYYAVSSSNSEPGRNLLLNIMRQKRAELLDTQWLELLSGESEDIGAEILLELQNAHMVQGLDQAFEPPQGSLETALPSLLADLAVSGDQVLLADDEGFSLANHGFEPGQAEELSGLSANLGLLHERHHHVLEQSLNLSSSAWAIVGAGGNSEVGFWPLYIGSQRFVLIIRGIPHLNRPALVSLIWALTRRYLSS
jgi:hypothetical protein